MLNASISALQMYIESFLFSFSRLYSDVSWWLSFVNSSFVVCLYLLDDVAATDDDDDQ